MENSLKRSYAITKFLTYFFLIIGSLIMVFPFLWMLLTSFKTIPESMQVPIVIFPSALRWDKYKEVLEPLPFVKLYWNTILLVFFRVICAIFFSSMAGYAFAKLKFRGKNLLFTLVLMQMSLPSQIFLIPQYQMVAKMGMANTIFALVFPWYRQRFRCILPAPDLYEHPRRGGRGRLPGRLQPVGDLL